MVLRMGLEEETRGIHGKIGENTTIYYKIHKIVDLHRKMLKFP